jgi:hypothetical protein
MSFTAFNALVAETANSPNSCVIVLVSSYITLFSARCLFSCQIQHQIYQIFVQYVCQIYLQLLSGADEVISAQYWLPITTIYDECDS